MRTHPDVLNGDPAEYDDLETVCRYANDAHHDEGCALTAWDAADAAFQRARQADFLAALAKDHFAERPPDTDHVNRLRGEKEARRKQLRAAEDRSKRWDERRRELIEGLA